MREKKIVSLYAVRPQIGEIGIEIEMEGEGLMKTQAMGQNKHGDSWPWQIKADGSLRGESCEWVLHRPVERNRVTSVLTMLWDAKEEAKATFRPSRRCGVHVHINVQNLTEKETFNFIGTYIAFENLMVRWAGADREGNLFCLRSCDARELIDQLVNARQAGTLKQAMSEHVRYASININAIARFGSLEFRALGTPANASRINQWVRMLWCIREFSLEFASLDNLLHALSRRGAQVLIEQVFGPRSVLRTIADKEELLREGIRNVQDLVLTQPSAMRGPMNFPGEGWHVHDPEDEAKWMVNQLKKKPEQPLYGGPYDGPYDVDEDDPDLFDGDDEREEEEEA